MSCPLVFNVFKPVGITSYDVIRRFKKNLPKGFGKIGHMGTLDPFACGVLMIGISSATKINDYVHKYLPKTYQGVGKLGVLTETGDMTAPVVRIDTSKYLLNEISNVSVERMQKMLEEEFVGDYWQIPHGYSATKFEGKALYKWAREGVLVSKEPVLRKIYSIEIVKYCFPYLSIRVSVSSGTYIRTLFQDIAKHLGTIGTLVSLIRESVGNISIKNSIRVCQWPKKNSDWNNMAIGSMIDHVLPLQGVVLSGQTEKKYGNGISVSLEDVEEMIESLNSLKADRDGNCWVYGVEKKLMGMGRILNNEIRPVFNLPNGVCDACSI